MFFFESLKVKVDIECPLVEMQAFEEALRILNMSKEEAFDEFIRQTIAIAEMRSGGIVEKPKENRLSDDAIKSRIFGWSRNKELKAHKMIKAFFKVAGIFDGKFADDCSKIKLSRIGENKKINRVLCNAFAFGGSNASLIMGK